LGIREADLYTTARFFSRKANAIVCVSSVDSTMRLAIRPAPYSMERERIRCAFARKFAIKSRKPSRPLSNWTRGCAISELEAELEQIKGKRGPDHWDVIDAKGRLARAYYDALQFQEADRLLQESLAALRRATSPPARQLSETLGLIGELEVTRANFTNAEVALLKAGRIPNSSKADERDRTRAQKRGGDRAHSPC